MNAQHTAGPWFIWQELAMQREECGADEINDELLNQDDLGIYAGDPVKCTRGSLHGHKAHICDIRVDGFDFDDDEEKSKQMAIANARLIKAAPTMLAELRSLRTLFKDQLDNFVESVTHPVTGQITDTDDRLSAEADQDRLNQIDAVIKLATGDDAPA